MSDSLLRDGDPDGVQDDEDLRQVAEAAVLEEEGDENEDLGQVEDQEDHEGEGEGEGDVRLRGRQDDGAVRRTRRSASDTIRELRERAQLAESRAEEIDRKFQGLEQRLTGQQSAADKAREAAEERERIALMQPHEVASYFYDKTQREMAQFRQQTQMEVRDAGDRASYEAKAQISKLHRQHAAEVERLQAAERARGNMVSREVVLAFIVGQKALQGAPAATRTAQRKAGQQRTQQAGRPTGARSDQAADRGQRRQGQSAADRLANVSF